jgi:hypothetical protein
MSNTGSDHAAAEVLPTLGLEFALAPGEMESEVTG